MVVRTFCHNRHETCHSASGHSGNNVTYSELLQLNGIIFPEAVAPRKIEGYSAATFQSDADVQRCCHGECWRTQTPESPQPIFGAMEQIAAHFYSPDFPEPYESPSDGLVFLDKFFDSRGGSVSGFVSFVDGQLTLEPRVMMTKTRAWALDAETAPVAPLPSASVLPVPSTAHQLLMRCQALLIQLLHNGWRYQEQSAISQAELLANDLSAVGFYRLAHVLGQFRNTESEARVEAMNNGVLLCEQLFPMLQQQG